MLLVSGHKMQYWCSQDSTRKQNVHLSLKEGAKHRDTLGMHCYNCHSCLWISCHEGDDPSSRQITINLQHHEPHTILWCCNATQSHYNHPREPWVDNTKCNGTQNPSVVSHSHNYTNSQCLLHHEQGPVEKRWSTATLSRNLVMKVFRWSKCVWLAESRWHGAAHMGDEENIRSASRKGCGDWYWCNMYMKLSEIRFCQC